MKERKQLLENNPMVFCLELEKHIKDGWYINEKEPFDMLFNLYTIGLVKEEISEELQEAIEEVFPPVILAEDLTVEVEVVEPLKSVGRPKGSGKKQN